MPCRLCCTFGDVGPSKPRSILQANFSDLCDAAKLECGFCSVIKDGVLQFANGDGVANISVIQQIETSRESRIGQKLPLDVTFNTRGYRDTTLQFYTADTSATKLLPYFPIASHISTDSSSSECLSQARKWLDFCVQNHSSHRCPMPAEVELPTRVICVGDTLTDPYLHESASGEKGVWAALSYCWGKVRTMTTTTASISERKSGFALDTLPKTCRDAILVARALSIPYIWIDSFCILQDSPLDWEREAARMCYTYENALVTFAALHSPSSDTGLFLPSLCRRTIRLDVHNNGQAAAVYVRKRHDVGVLGFMHGYFSDSSHLAQGSGILETRGWTLQEVMLSPRLLWFSSSELGWSCWSSTACECDPEQTSDFVDRSAEYVKISSSPLLDQNIIIDWLATWRTLVHEFTKRTLTVQKDRLPAISGLASALKTHIDSDYLAGLWESDLATQLLWASSWSAFNANPSLLPLEDGYAPSWSWASVSGAVRFLEVRHPRFSLTWEILSVRFRPLGLDPFTRGEGSITVAGNLLQVRWADGNLLWDLPADDGVCIENVSFCAVDSILMDPRAEIRDQKAMADKRLSFLVAGLSMKNSKSSEPDVPLFCNGLLLEHLPGKRAFTRLGFAEPHFDEPGTEGSWAVWEERCTRKRIDIV